MKPFLSLPKKIMLLLLAMLLSIAATLSWLWLSKTNQDYLIKQQEVRQQNQQQYTLVNDMNRNRLESWIELFVQINRGDDQQVAALVTELTDKFEYLQLHWQVEHVWMTDDASELLFSSRPGIPKHVEDIALQAQRQQRSASIIHCDVQCLQVLSIPVLLENGDIATITASFGMLETLAFLNRSTGATLAMVYVPSNVGAAHASNLYIRGPLARGHLEFFNDLISGFPKRYQINQLLAEGIQVRHNDSEYLLNLIPMAEGIQQSNFILSAHDITPVVQAHSAYQRSLMITAFIVFAISGLLFYMLTSSFRDRLTRLSERLPLLAQQQYDKFQASKLSSRHLFSDELDHLVASSDELGERLEALDKQVVLKTTELERIAMYDSLTSLPNRNMLLFQLQRAIKKMGRKPGMVVILFFDLDDFKKVNDSYGHGVGDALLVQASKRFEGILRKTDLACRFGGDEFVVMLNMVEDIDGAIRVAEKLLKAFQEPISVERRRFYMSTSIGMAATTDCKTDAQDFVRNADIAMYQAKEAGGNCYKMYNVQMSQRALDKVALEAEARDALIDDQFTFALQPQLELSTNRLIGFEALLRWFHPDRGAVSPSQFIPVLENTEFMLALGRWCIDNAFDLLLDFNKRGLGNLKIAVNLASNQFLDPDLIPLLKSKLNETGIKPELIELELTERTLVADVERTTKIMRELINIGFLISIDDFGTGYSSLSYLKRMPAHIIKIDRSFIDGMLSSKADKQIVSSTIDMVQNLGMKVIAEGIEEFEQFEMLKGFSCDMAQGYLMARPILQADLFTELESKMVDGVWDWQTQSIKAS